MNKYFLLLVFVLGIISCQKEPEVEPVDYTEEINAGGEKFTTHVRGENVFGSQSEFLNHQESRLFVSGNSLFRTNWVSAPSSVQSLDGLGPVFNAISCGSCHFKDGRAAPPDEFSIEKTGLLLRIGLNNFDNQGQSIPHPIYGKQLQDKALPAAAPEARVNINYEEIQGQYRDGTNYSLRKPIYSLTDYNYGSINEPILISPRIAPQIYGLGLLENIAEEDILVHADPEDLNQDGISGKANYIYDINAKEEKIGRFGWKANEPSLIQQSAGAFNGDMGLTTSYFPKTDWTDAQEVVYPEILNGGDPEVSDEQLLRVELYVRALAVPAAREVSTSDFQAGKLLFQQLKCQSCHTPTFTTGSTASIAALNGQMIRPYTDLLLHDMGADLADNKPDGQASGTEWRTPPLWGLGLVPAVNGHTRYLHDGRARNLEEAILWHGGEATNSVNAFKELIKQDRDKLLYFLERI